MLKVKSSGKRNSILFSGNINGPYSTDRSGTLRDHLYYTFQLLCRPIFFLVSQICSSSLSLKWRSVGILVRGHLNLDGLHASLGAHQLEQAFLVPLSVVRNTFGSLHPLRYYSTILHSG